MNQESFRTSLIPKKSDHTINLNQKIITIGSCFSDVIGRYLSKYKFNALSNSFGTVYNPISIFQYLKNEGFSDDHYIKVNDHYFHFDAHSKFNAKEESTLRTLLKNQEQGFNQFLESADWLVITLGTAFIYARNETTRIVANCHKIPQSEFSKRLLTIEEIKHSFDESLKVLRKANPKVKVLLTVSPVRHIKDGMEDNSVSKAVLRSFCHEVVARNEEVLYFPSYEIMMDDLRDYRFYKEDMIHPSTVAEEYIWNFFQKTFFSEDTQAFIKRWQKILNAMNHKPFNPKSEIHQKFIQNTIKKIDEFSNLIDIVEEREYFELQLG